MMVERVRVPRPAIEVNEMIVKHNIKNSKDDEHKDAGGNGDNSSDSGSGSSGNNGAL